jgi:hypothetical protein
LSKLRAHHSIAVFAAVAIGLTIAGCGGSNPLDAGLGRFLVRPGEAPGFTLGKAAIKATQAREALNGSEGLQGASGVLVLSSVKAARAKAQSLLSTGAGDGYSSSEFPVPGVPGAAGLVQDSPDNGDQAAAFWIQGRCVVIVGDLAVSGTATSSPLVSAAQAVYKRTKALKCP